MDHLLSKEPVFAAMQRSELNSYKFSSLLFSFERPGLS